MTIVEISLPQLEWVNETPKSNQEQIHFSEKLNKYTRILKDVDAQLKSNKDALIEIWLEADKLLKIKGDKNWNELELNNLNKVLDDLQSNWKFVYEQINYWQSQLSWLQSKFPDAVYADVVGLCKVADKSEIAEEQGYSLNAGRYVGVVSEDDLISDQEFKMILKEKYNLINQLNKISSELEAKIEKNLKALYF